MIKELKSQRLGQIIQESRKKLGKRQEDIATLLGVSRPIVIAIEKGERGLKPSELVKLQTELHFDLGNVLRDKPHVEPFSVRFRAIPSISKVKESDNTLSGIESAIEVFNQLVTDYIELEYILQNSIAKYYPEPYTIRHLPIELAAEQVANRERSRLELGTAPIDMRSLLDDSIGVRVFMIDMPSNYSGMFHYSESTGGCIAINKKHPYERQQFSMAHEYAHMIAHRIDHPNLISEYSNEKYAEERFANAFARYFLMPRVGIQNRFNDLLQERQNGKISLTDIVSLAHYYKVSVTAMTLRLEEMQALRKGTHVSIKESKLNINDVQQGMGIESRRSHQELPLRFRMLAYQAYHQEQISLSLLSKFLRLPIVETRAFVDKMEDEVSNVDTVDFAAL